MSLIRRAPRELIRRQWSAVRVLSWAGVAQLCMIVGASQQPEHDDILRKAQELQTHHQTEAAIALLRTYAIKHPGDAQTLTALAQLLDDAGEKEEAARQLAAALSANPNSVAANIATGKLLLSEHKYPEAMDRLETVLSIDVHNADARRGEYQAAMELAVSARGAGHPEIALQVLEHARSKLPDDPKLLLSLGLEATELGNFAEAETSLHAAAQVAPNDADIVYALARLDTERQHMEAAEEEYRAYLTMRPGDASAHFGLGHALAMMQRVEEARAEFETSIKLQPLQTESYYQVGQLELDAQQDSKARPFFEKVLSRDPKHAGALTGMGILAFRAKDYAQAERFLEAAEESASNYGAAHYYRGLTLARMGRKTESEDELRVAAKLGSALKTPMN